MQLIRAVKSKKSCQIKKILFDTRTEHINVLLFFMENIKGQKNYLFGVLQDPYSYSPHFIDVLICTCMSKNSPFLTKLSDN